MLDWTLHLLNHPWIPWAAVGFLFFWGGGHWLVMQRKFFSPLYRQIVEARQQLEETPEEPSVFATRFRDIDARLSRFWLLAPTWSTFSKTLIFSSRGTPLQGSREPNHFFNAESLMGQETARYYYHTIPSLLLGVGVLFTLIGLVAAIRFAIEGLASGDLYVSKQALQGLLNAASLKFLSSIAGFMVAMLFSWEEKRQSYRLGQEGERICQILAERIEFVGEGQMGREQLRESQAQSRHLQGIFDRLNQVTGQTILPSSNLSAEPGKRVGQAGGGSEEAFLERLVVRFAQQFEATMTPLRDSVLTLGETIKTKTFPSLTDLKPLLTSVQQEGERLLQANEVAMGKLLEGVNRQFASLSTDTSLAELHPDERTELLERLGDRMEGAVANLGHAGLSPFQNIATQIEKAATALESYVKENAGAVTLPDLERLVGSFREEGERILADNARASGKLLVELAQKNASSQVMFASSVPADSPSDLPSDLLERIAQHMEQAVVAFGEGVGSQMSEQTDLLEQIVMHNQAVRQPLMALSSQPNLQPLLTGMQQEGERLLQAFAVTMGQLLEGIHRQFSSLSADSTLAELHPDERTELLDRLAARMEGAVANLGDAGLSPFQHIATQIEKGVAALGSYAKGDPDAITRSDMEALVDTLRAEGARILADNARASEKLLTKLLQSKASSEQATLASVISATPTMPVAPADLLERFVVQMEQAVLAFGAEVGPQLNVQTGLLKQIAVQSQSSIVDKQVGEGEGGRAHLERFATQFSQFEGTMSQLKEPLVALEQAIKTFSLQPDLQPFERLASRFSQFEGTMSQLKEPLVALEQTIKTFSLRPDLQPLLSQVQQEGERLLQANEVAMSQLLEGVSRQWASLSADSTLAELHPDERTELLDRLAARMEGAVANLGDAGLSPFKGIATQIEKGVAALGVYAKENADVLTLFDLERLVESLRAEGARVLDSNARANEKFLSELVQEEVGPLLRAQTDLLEQIVAQKPSLVGLLGQGDKGGGKEGDKGGGKERDKGDKQVKGDFEVALLERLVSRFDETMSQLREPLVTLEKTIKTFSPLPDLQPLLSQVQQEGARLLHANEVTMSQLLEGIGRQFSSLSADTTLAELHPDERTELLDRLASRMEGAVANLGDAGLSPFQNIAAQIEKGVATLASYAKENVNAVTLSDMEHLVGTLRVEGARILDDNARASEKLLTELTQRRVLPVQDLSAQGALAAAAPVDLLERFVVQMEQAVTVFGGELVPQLNAQTGLLEQIAAQNRSSHPLSVAKQGGGVWEEALLERFVTRFEGTMSQLREPLVTLEETIKSFSPMPDLQPLLGKVQQEAERLLRANEATMSQLLEGIGRQFSSLSADSTLAELHPDERTELLDRLAARMEGAVANLGDAGLSPFKNIATQIEKGVAALDSYAKGNTDVMTRSDLERLIDTLRAEGERTLMANAQASDKLLAELVQNNALSKQSVRAQMSLTTGPMDLLERIAVQVEQAMIVFGRRSEPQPSVQANLLERIAAQVEQAVTVLVATVSGGGGVMDGMGVAPSTQHDLLERAAQMERAIVASLVSKVEKQTFLSDLEPLMARVRHEGERLFQANEAAMAKLLESVSRQFSSVHADATLAELLPDERAQMMDTLAVRMEGTMASLGDAGFSPFHRIATQLEKAVASLENVLDEKTQMTTVGAGMSPDMHALVGSLREEGTRILTANEDMIDRLVTTLAHQGSAVGGALFEPHFSRHDLQPLIESVRSEGERLFQANEVGMAKLLESVNRQVSTLHADAALAELLPDERTRMMDTLAGRMEGALSTLGDAGLSPFRHIAAQLEKAATAMEHVLEEKSVNATVGAGVSLDIQPLIVSLREEVSRVLTANENVLERLVGELLRQGDAVGSDLFPGEQLSMLEHIAAQIERAIVTLGEKVEASSTQSNIKSLLNDMRQEGMQLVRANEEAMRKMLEVISQRFTETTASATLSELYPDERENLLERVATRMEQAVAGLGEVGLTPFFDGVRQEMARVPGLDQYATSDVLASSFERVVQQLDGVVAALESRVWASDVTPDMTPMVTTIRQEGERFLAANERAMDRMFAEISQRAFVGSLGSGNSTEQSALLQHISAQLENIGRALTDKTAVSTTSSVSDLEPLLDRIQGEGERLVQANEAAMTGLLNEVVRRFAGATTTHALAELHPEERSELLHGVAMRMEQAVASLGELGLAPFFDGMRQEVGQLIQGHQQAVSLLVEEITQRNREQGAKEAQLLERVVAQVSHSIATMGDKFSAALLPTAPVLPEALIEAIQGEGTRLYDAHQKILVQLEGLSERADPAEHPVGERAGASSFLSDLEPLFHRIQSEGARLVQANETAMAGLLNEVVRRFAGITTTTALAELHPEERSELLDGVSIRMEQLVSSLGELGLAPFLDTIRQEVVPLIQANQQAVTQLVAGMTQRDREQEIKEAQRLEVVVSQVSDSIALMGDTLRTALPSASVLSEELLEIIRGEGARLHDNHQRVLAQLETFLARVIATPPEPSKEPERPVVPALAPEASMGVVLDEQSMKPLVDGWRQEGERMVMANEMAFERLMDEVSLRFSSFRGSEEIDLLKHLATQLDDVVQVMNEQARLDDPETMDEKEVVMAPSQSDLEREVPLDPNTGLASILAEMTRIMSRQRSEEMRMLRQVATDVNRSVASLDAKIGRASPLNLRTLLDTVQDQGEKLFASSQEILKHLQDGASALTPALTEMTQLLSQQRGEEMRLLERLATSVNRSVDALEAKIGRATPLNLKTLVETVQDQGDRLVSGSQDILRELHAARAVSKAGGGLSIAAPQEVAHPVSVVDHTEADATPMEALVAPVASKDKPDALAGILSMLATPSTFSTTPAATVSTVSEVSTTSTVSTTASTASVPFTSTASTAPRTAAASKASVPFGQKYSGKQGSALFPWTTATVDVFDSVSEESELPRVSESLSKLLATLSPSISVPKQDKALVPSVAFVDAGEEGTVVAKSKELQRVSHSVHCVDSDDVSSMKISPLRPKLVADFRNKKNHPRSPFTEFVDKQTADFFDSQGRFSLLKP